MQTRTQSNSNFALTPHSPPELGGRRARRRVLTLLALAGLSTLIGGCGKGVSEATIEFVGIDEVRELQSQQGSEPRTILLIDPRSPRRFAEGHIPGAVSVQLPEVATFGGRDARLSGYANLVVYGENPASPTARAMTKRLLGVGYETVRLYPGGLEEWVRADYPVETSELPEGYEVNAPD